METYYSLKYHQRYTHEHSLDISYHDTIQKGVGDVL